MLFRLALGLFVLALCRYQGMGSSRLTEQRTVTSSGKCVRYCTENNMHTKQVTYIVSKTPDINLLVQRLVKELFGCSPLFDVKKSKPLL